MHESMTTISLTNAITPHLQLMNLLKPVYARNKDASDIKSHLLPVIKQWLDQERELLCEQFVMHQKPRQYLLQHAQLFDTILACLYTLITEGKTPKVAVAAVGGYGRKELFPYSDLDLVFIFDERDQEQSQIIANFILYILWDLGITVGQSHRTIEECLQLAKEDHTVRANLLDMRFITGRKKLCISLYEQFRADITNDDITKFVEAKLVERDARHKRFGDSRYVLEPNVKEGKGALRDIHTIWWLARYLYPLRRMHDLVRMNMLSESEYKSFNNARQFLWRVRINLHIIANRSEERLTFDQQHALATSMGYTHESPNRAIERFMRRYFVSVRMVGNATRIICAILEEEKLRPPRKSLTWLWNAPWKLDGFKLEGTRLMPRSDTEFEKNPIAMLEIFRVAQQHELQVHPRTLQQIARSLHQIDAHMHKDSAANNLFMDILLGKNCETVLRRMSEAGVLGSFIPDFGRVIGQTQFNMYHVYTVDEHTLVLLGILQNIENGYVYSELPLATQIIKRIKMRRVLYLASFCHDIAKGRPADHSELGEKVAKRLAKRFGFSKDEIATTAWLVRYHLLFSNTAFKRDIDDPKTVQDFVAMVRTPERLKLLLILTAADIRAVAPGVWNAWKGALLRDLYHRAEQIMGTGEITLKHHDKSSMQDALQQRLSEFSQEEIQQYFDAITPAMLAHFDPSRHVGIARMLRQITRQEVPLLMDTQHTPQHAITEITICTYDQPALFSKLAGAFSLCGANIISAKIFTLKNGMAVDVFQVQGHAGHIFDRPDKLARLVVYLKQALSGDLDFKKAFDERKKSAPSSRKAIPIHGQVFIENDASNLYSVIEVNGRDRPGLLHAITSKLSDLGLTIAAAQITTYGLQAADVFYVKDAFGLKITHKGHVQKLRSHLQACVEE